ncbi:hypothetical protein DDB_G0267896 [Dictyostelium discoideum AX4]|uniref:Uncharacterized protein n=1 Tax=Dictyostelium discoideum TaxID=44689 RepID=Q55FZ1_DICDI|nr:hypothetical protein DDB_G0267896 [Dictyostelium discoideum AX4]EAL73401.1 hypothetical protein DDB_G0267896 [Dictyostelium discoideum AX4]|eukprot:XP_647392.1 hypothetical protein DDB_G0267896 [Dictyostelium discoideum AX4]
MASNYPQLSPQPLLIPVNEITQEKYIVNQFSKTTLKGSLLKGYSETFPYELTNVMAPQDYNAIVKEINSSVKSKKFPVQSFIGLLMLSTVCLFFSPMAFVVIFPISVSLITISLIGIHYFLKRISEKIEKTLINFNNVFATRRVSIEFSKKSIFRTKVKIIYPASLAIQPVLYNIQPIQQSFYQQNPQQSQYAETSKTADSSPLLSKV